jgi:hypothetical protein
VSTRQQELGVAETQGRGGRQGAKPYCLSEVADSREQRPYLARVACQN